MHGFARAGPHSREHDSTQIAIDGRMAESEPAFESEEYACGSLLDLPSRVIAPNASIRLVQADDWASEFPSEHPREDSILVLAPRPHREPTRLPALDVTAPAPRTRELVPADRDHSTQYRSSGSMLRLARRARAFSVKSAARLMHGGEIAWSVLVHATHSGTAAGVGLGLKSRTILLTAGHGFTRCCSRSVELVASTPLLARGQTAENTNAASSGQLWRVVAWMAVPSFCSGVAVGGITVSLFSGLLPWPPSSAAATQASPRPRSNVEEVVATVLPPRPPVEIPVVAGVVPTVGTGGRTEAPRASVAATARDSEAKPRNSSDGVARTSEATATRQVQSVVFRGSLALNSNPQGAQVLVNGEPAGTTPLTLARVPAGSRVVRIELEGYEPWSTLVRVVANQRTRVTGNLTPRR